MTSRISPRTPLTLTHGLDLPMGFMWWLSYLMHLVVLNWVFDKTVYLLFMPIVIVEFLWCSSYRRPRVDVILLSVMKFISIFISLICVHHSSVVSLLLGLKRDELWLLDLILICVLAVFHFFVYLFVAIYLYKLPLFRRLWCVLIRLYG